MLDTIAFDTTTLLKTKLYPPPVTPDLVPRPDLLERLERNRQRPLTLISAPAGYGKSVLASMWLEASNQPGAWISLDASENDLFLFLSYLLVGIKTAVPEAPLQQSQALLELPALPPISIVATYLMNDLDQITTSFILVLDDIHVIDEPAIFELITLLVKYPSPTVHLILIGRQDPPLPIGSLRAYRQITEVRLRDLRFSLLETARFFQRALAVDVSDSVAAEWAEKTEGWAVALRLAVISLSNRRKTLDSGSIIQGKNQYLQEYLMAEVLAQLSPARQACLLKISLLDRFCAPLCAVVCEELGETNNVEGLTAEAFIQWLRESNLFLIPLDDNSEWFRLHQLFQDYLRNLLERQLSPQEITTLHLRASRWLAENGWPEEAIKLSLAAGETSGAVELVAQHRDRLMDAERWTQLDHWLRLFPDEAIVNDPILAITRAHLPAAYGLEQAQILARTHQLLADLPDDSPVARMVKGELIYFSVLWGVMVGPADGVIEQANEALALLPQQPQSIRISMIAAKAVGLQMLDDYDRGVRLITETVDDPDWSANARAKLLIIQSYASFFAGDLKGVQRSANKALEIAIRNQLWKTMSEGHYMAGIAHYWRNETNLAEPHLSFLVEKRVFLDPIYVAQGVCALARIYRAKGQPEKASEAFEIVFSHLEEVENTFSLKVLRAFQVELTLDQGDLTLAQQLSQTVDFNMMNGVIWYHFMPQLASIKLLLAEGTAKSLNKALAALEQVEQQLRTLNRKPQIIDVLALQALAYQAQGNWPAASEKLSAALRLSEPGGFIRNYVDLGLPMAGLLAQLHDQGDAETGAYISQILAAFQTEKRVTSAPDPENHLTKREQETLSLLATDLSPQEISSQMVISPATVRTHIRNIYAKLEVNGRFEAVQVAKEQGLL